MIGKKIKKINKYIYLFIKMKKKNLETIGAKRNNYIKKKLNAVGPSPLPPKSTVIYCSTTFSLVCLVLHMAQLSDLLVPAYAAL